MQIVRIDSLEDPRLDVFRDLKSTRSTRHRDMFVVEGTTLVERLLHSSWTVDVVLASEQKLRNFQQRIPAGTTVYEVTRALASDLVGYRFHLGVIAAAQRKPSPDLSALLSTAESGLVVLGDHLIDPENVGMTIRIAAAFGATGIVLTRGSTDAFSRRALRVSMGNGLFLPVIENADVGAVLEMFRQHDYESFASVLDDQAEPVSAVRFPPRSVIVVGNETHGISSTIRNGCRRQITIPMYHGTDSLNVSIATGIFCHEYRAQNASSEGSQR